MHSWEDSDIAKYSQNYSCSFSPFSFPFQYSYRDLSRGIVVRAIAPEKKVKLSFCILLCLGITQEHMCYIMIQRILHHRSRWKSECLETLSKGASLVPRDHSTKKITIEMGRKRLPRESVLQFQVGRNCGLSQCCSVMFLSWWITLFLINSPLVGLLGFLNIAPFR